MYVEQPPAARGSTSAWRHRHTPDRRGVRGGSFTRAPSSENRDQPLFARNHSWSSTIAPCVGSPSSGAAATTVAATMDPPSGDSASRTTRGGRVPFFVLGEGGHGLAREHQTEDLFGEDLHVLTR